MSKRTWKNFECTFNTENDSNTLPDSRYVVFASEVQRAGFVNAGPGRSGHMVSIKPAICYLHAGTELYDAVRLRTRHTGIHVLYVDGDLICVKVDRSPKCAETVGFAYRRPMNGYFTFDFYNDDGRLTHIHHGHRVKNVAVGASNADVDAATKELKAVRRQVDAKTRLLEELMGELEDEA